MIETFFITGILLVVVPQLLSEFGICTYRLANQIGTIGIISLIVGGILLVYNKCLSRPHR